MSKYVTTRPQKTLHSRRNCPNLKGRTRSNIREASQQEREILDKCCMCHFEFIECEHCGEVYQVQGMGSHKMYCEENPDRVGSKVPVLDS